MVMYNGPFPPFPHHFFVFCFKDCRNTFATYLQYPNGKTAERVAGAFSFTFRARGVIRFLLECNISYRRSRCVNSLIRGDKYRRDTSPKQTARAADRWCRASETRKWDKRFREGGKRGPTEDAVLSLGIRWAPSPRKTSIATAGGPRSNCLPGTGTGQSGVPPGSAL